MKSFFDQLHSEGFSRIERMVAERQQENVTLEFKEKNDPRHGRITKEDRQTLAETLSAFANSAGGLLIFGIEARKDIDGVDAATSIKAITGVDVFQTEATHALGELLLPRHDGIEVLALPRPDNPSEGCLAIWVERSERRPHQSQAAKDRRYYKRSGDSTFVMEHYDIEDALRRLVAPILVLDRRYEPGAKMGGPMGTVTACNLQFTLTNTSPVTARFPYLHFVGLSGIHLNRPWANVSPLKFREQNGQLCFDGGADIIVHPDQELLVAALEIGVLQDGAGRMFLVTGPTRYGHYEDIEKIPIETAVAGYQCVFGAENCRMQRRAEKFEGATIRTMLGI